VREGRRRRNGCKLTAQQSAGTRRSIFGRGSWRPTEGRTL